MSFRILPPQNTAAELDAFEAVCRQLGGFDGALGFERIDGFLTALAAGPRLPPASQWLSALCGDAFERAFGDPEAHAAALQTLQRRLKLLCAQLDPEALFDDPDALRLEPQVAEWTDADRQQMVDAEGWSDAEAAGLQTGTEWAIGFTVAVDRHALLWAPPADEELAAQMAHALAAIRVLMLPGGDPLVVQHLQSHYPPGATPDRESLFVDACMAAQDLRMHWVDAVPRGQTRRVAPTPGRNDPCACGSGKKYKKCHGAAAPAA